MKSNKNKLYKLRKFVNGEVNTRYEVIMLVVIIVNIVSLGVDTSKNISPAFKNILFWIDQISLILFVIELLLKVLAYNKEFFGEWRTNKKGEKELHINIWNISDLLIVSVSIFSSLSYFGVFRIFRFFRSIKDIKMIRSMRIVKSFKIVNKFANLRKTFKRILKAIPGILWTFCFLAIFAYSYAVIGTNVFAQDFPKFFGTIGTSLLSLCQITTLDAWFSEIGRPVTSKYPLAWIYFISYTFIAASIIMNVITGFLVDSVSNKNENPSDSEDLSQLSDKISDLSQQISELKMKIDKLDNTP